MRDVFLPGPFAEADMLGAMLGEGAAPPVEPAALSGHALHADPSGGWVGLVPAEGGRVAGGVVRVDAAIAARLAFVLGGMGGGVPHRTATDAGLEVEAFVSPGAAAPPWPDAPDREWRAHLAEVAEEVASHFGARAVAGIPALLQGMSYRALGRVRGRSGTTPVEVRRGYGVADIEPVEVARPYARYFTVEERRLRHRRFDGAMSAVVDRAVFCSGDAVTLLPFDPVRRAVLLIEQFRAGPLARRDPHPWCLEAVAGRCDAGEGPEATARREAREEAGLAIGRIERIGGYYSSPGILSEHITAFVGEADLGRAGGVHGLAAEDEDIRAIVLPLGEATGLVASGEANNAPLLISLLWLGREADRLVAAWAP